MYAWVLDPWARVLLLDVGGGRMNLPGGTPEPFDADWRATLRREVLEEADVTVRDVVWLGFQEVCSDGEPPYAQIRVAARLDRWWPSSPDPDNGRVYARRWVPLGEAAPMLGWGGPGRAQEAAVARVARDIYGMVVAAGIAQGASAASAVVMQVV
ncbi:NUDIX hydrolase [Yinghuangia sp. ASG 101]|uniref:NUDIX hydrolase n=1 Tax=Yinghuangia sp. ASG 101 TaxID=2896848 RepID=UPI001E438B6E|nr:NUDIX hydrolase [Yinghuangia sp. ASG 101]UGQ15647.1 NUDIX hydrolase [Yinghuangia sp. ASG 101]